ncbi:MAG: MerR family transcriptional regulator [Caldilineaceae bacterium]
MNNNLLGEYSTAPLYNIKAVVQTTDISPSTLRAWERRYHICQPQRLENGYRLYSDRDIAILQWLKNQVALGLSISQATAWLDNLAAAANGIEHVALPPLNYNGRSTRLATFHRPQAQRDYSTLQHELLDALLRFDEAATTQIIAEAFTLYPLELVGENLFKPVLIEIGQRWAQGDVSVTTEHFATNYLQQRIAALLHILPNAKKEALIWVGCPPGEDHEIGAFLLTLYLRRAGYAVQYIGKNLVSEDFVQEVQLHHPALVLFSVSRDESLQALQTLIAQLNESSPAPPLIGYGGRIFQNRPELCKQVNGIYLGDSALDALDYIAELLQNSTLRQADAKRSKAHL